jgi:hypothetical protein
VIAANAEAIRFYERLDLLPFMVSYIGNVPASPSTHVSAPHRGCLSGASDLDPTRVGQISDARAGRISVGYSMPSCLPPGMRMRVAM